MKRYLFSPKLFDGPALFDTAYKYLADLRIQVGEPGSRWGLDLTPGKWSAGTDDLIWATSALPLSWVVDIIELREPVGGEDVLISVPRAVWESAISQGRWATGNVGSGVESRLIPARWYALDKRAWESDLKK